MARVVVLLFFDYGGGLLLTVFYSELFLLFLAIQYHIAWFSNLRGLVTDFSPVSVDLHSWYTNDNIITGVKQL